MIKRLFGIYILLTLSINCLAQLEKHVQKIISLAIDKAGNIYLGGYAGGYLPASIYKVDSKGKLSILASGKLSYAHRELDLSHANLVMPRSMVVDSKGNLFISDHNQDVIKKITTGGVLSIFAGSGKGNLKDGQGKMAEFYDTEGMTIDAADNIYVIDQRGTVIRKIRPDGSVTTYMAKNSALISLKDIVIDRKGNLFVSDIGGGTIKKIEPDGKISVIAGSQLNGHIDGQGKAARFKRPDKLCIDSEDNLYVEDEHYIRKISPGGMVTTVAGQKFTEGELSDIESDNRSMGKKFDRDGNAKKIYLPLIDDIICDKNDIIYFVADEEKYLRMLRNGQVYTMGRYSEPFIARNIPETNEKYEPDLSVAKRMPDQKEIERMVDSMLKKNLATFPQMGASGYSVPTKPDTNDSRKLPLLNQRKLDLASRKLNTREDVVAYINELDSKISEGLKETKVKTFASAHENASAAYAYWMGGKPRESLLCAFESVKQQSEVDYILNNTATILGLCGMEYMGVPLLIVCLKNEPENSTINNNLGQAYLTMGDQKTAEVYLKKVLRINPYHPHANNSMGYLAEKQGKRTVAVDYYKNSIKGSFTTSAVNGLLRISPSEVLKMMDLIRHRYRSPNYIKFNSFAIPHQSLGTFDQSQKKAEHDNYQAKLKQQKDEIEKLAYQQKPLAEAANKRASEMIIKKQKLNQPFQELAYFIVASLRDEYSKKIVTLSRQHRPLYIKMIKLKIEYLNEMAEADEKFRERMDAVGEGNPDPGLDEEICRKKDIIANKYIPTFGTINEVIFSDNIDLSLKYLNDILFWERFLFYSDEEYKLEYLNIQKMFIWNLQQLQLNYYPTEDCQKIHEAIAASKEHAFKSNFPPCPLLFDIEIPFVVGKVNVGCSGWGLEMGEGLIMNIDHVFGGETTFALGVGLSHDFLGKDKAKSLSTPELGIRSFSPIPGLDAGAKGQFFLTLKNGNVVDGGLLYEYEVDLKGITKPLEMKQTYIFAVNNGFTDEGMLSDLGNKWFFDVPKVPKKDKPINKHLPKVPPKNVPK